MTFGYNHDRLIEVLDTLGRSIRYYYNADGRLIEVRDFTGRTIQFGYDPHGDLVTVTSPSVMGTPNGNDFPRGKTIRYRYLSGLKEESLNQLLVEVVAPEEADAGGPPRVQIEYEHDPASADLGRVLRQTVGGVNAHGVSAGGTIVYQYEPLSGASRTDLNTPVSQTTVIDRNGNRTEYQFAHTGNPVRVRELTNRGVRTYDSDFFETILRYNKDGELTLLRKPEGNSVEYTYDDRNPDRLQQGNCLSETLRSDGKRGGDQQLLRTTYTYDPIYSQRRTVTEARGNDVAFVPQNGGANSPKRYTTRFLFDYEEGSDLARLAQHIGRPVAEVRELLDRAGMTLGRGDLNNDGHTDQVAGNVVKVIRPTVTLLSDSNMTRVEGSFLQPIEMTFAYGPHGQLTNYRDAEGNVTLYSYYPENDPNGGGKDLTPSVGTAPAGYLKEVIRDTNNDPIRDSGSNPTPAKLRRRYAYDRVGNVIRDIDGRGVATDYTVNELNQVVEAVRAADVSAALANSGEPDWRACADDGLSECTRGMVAHRYRTLLTYDANNNLIRRSDENRDSNTTHLVGDWVVTEFVYDILDNLIEYVRQINTVPGEAITTRYRYDRNGNQILRISPVATLASNHPDYQPSNVVSHVFDERDLSAVSTQGGLTALFMAQSAHTSIPELHVIPRSPDIFSRTYRYDGNRNLTEVLNGADVSDGAPPHRTRFFYDSFDRPISTVDAIGNQSFRQYDPAGNLIRISRFGHLSGRHPDDGLTANLDQPMQPEGFEQPLLSQVEYKYDELGRPFERSEGDFLYDGVRYLREVVFRDRMRGQSGGGWITSRREYDRLGRLTFIVNPDLGAGRVRYDGVGRVILAGDPEENEWIFAYDGNGNLVTRTEVEVTQPDAVEARRLPELRETFSTINVYDSLNRLIRVTDNLGQTTRYEYDSRNNLVLVSDAQYSSGPSDLIDDPLGLFPPEGHASRGATEINRPGNTTEFLHDGANRRIARVLHLRVDGQGANPIDVSNPTNPDGLVVTDYQWDANSRLVAIADDGHSGNQNTSVGEIEPANPLGNVTRIRYTDLNQVGQATFPDGSILGHSYNAFNQLEIITDRNGSQIHFTYDSAELVQSAEVMSASSSDPHPLGGFKDPSVSWQVIGTQRQTFTHDGLYRLVLSTDSDDPLPSDADAIVAAFSYDSRDRLVEEGQGRGAEEATAVISSSFDVADNRTRMVYPNGRELDLAYDRLRRIKRIRDSGAPNALVSYDYIGPQRIARRDYQNGATLAYVTDIEPGRQVG